MFAAAPPAPAPKPILQANFLATLEVAKVIVPSKATAPSASNQSTISPRPAARTIVSEAESSHRSNPALSDLAAVARAAVNANSHSPAPVRLLVCANLVCCFIACLEHRMYSLNDPVRIQVLKSLACHSRATPASSHTSPCLGEALTSPLLHACGCASPVCACFWPMPYRDSIWHQ